MHAAVDVALAELEPGDRVLVALSGGPDSLALCGAAARVGEQRALLVGAAIVDHGLQEGSAQRAATAAAQASILGCQETFVMRVSVATTGGPEAAARDARHAVLRDCAQSWGARVILLGHTRDDQAETVLMRLARGSGTRSLAAMAAASGSYRRPLLDLPREVVAAAAADQAADDDRLVAWHDPHNSDSRFTRSRVRGELLPTLTAVLGPGAIAGLCRTAEMARADADALDQLAAARMTQLVPCMSDPAALGAVRLPALPRAVMGEPAAIATRVLRTYLLASGCPAEHLTRDHVTQVGRVLSDPTHRAQAWLPGGLVARSDARGLTVSPGGPAGSRAHGRPGAAGA